MGMASIGMTTALYMKANGGMMQNMGVVSSEEAMVQYTIVAIGIAANEPMMRLVS